MSTYKKMKTNYLKEHSIDKLGFKDVHLGAGISKAGLQDKNAANPDSICLVAIVQSSARIPAGIKSKIEDELLKDNPYMHDGKEFPVYIKYQTIAKAY